MTRRVFVWLAGSLLVWPRRVGAEEFRRSSLQRLAARVRAIRGAGSSTDGLHTLSLPVKITEADYWLMGSDNSSAARNFPDISRKEREEQRWFAAARGWNPPSWNSHGISEDGGKTYHVETFLTSLPRSQYQATPEEVAWHAIRVKELRAAQMPIEQRVKTMTREAKEQPWKTWR